MKRQSKSDKHRLIMISLDAVGKRDMEFMLSLPNFAKIVENGAFCDNVYSVYPSLTYPAHTAIMTGRVPDNSGIVSNTKLQPNRKTPDWFYKRKYIHGTTLPDEATKKGYKVCSLLWPVLGGAKISYNLPEVLVTRKYQNQVTACLANGTPKYLIELNSKFGHIRKGIEQPALDDFLMASAKYTIEKYDPDMMMIHLTDVDTNRHNHGADNEYIKEALLRHDKRLGELKEWLEKTRPMEDTTFIVLGDHCQIDAHTIVYPNKYLADKGFIDIKDGKITDYRLIAQCLDGSFYVRLNEKFRNDEEVLEQALDLLNEMKKADILGIEAVFTGEEAALMGADGSCLVMAEGKRGFYYLNEYDVLSEKVEDTKNHKMFAIHGCLPSKEENLTFFAAQGKGIKKGVRIPSMRLWDEGPTIAKLMGWNLGGVDGEIIKDILE
ncbi:MAG: ectonucleotide pyrophosphatase/phosphodiesterase [Lachnospiraceae bacterium]|nr:ectonucleotide pyrophosphatase/phosphodiesterase [Lachnospiraceae bacterium]